MFVQVLAVAAGGAVGAALRYGVNILAVHAFGHGFPFATLFVNILGSFLMGALVAGSAHLGSSGDGSKVLMIFLTTGVLGAFTTFSTFSLDFVSLFERGAMAPAFVYLVFSVVVSIAALFAGLVLVRMITS